MSAMDFEYQQFQVPATSSFSFHPNVNLLTGRKRVMAYVPYGLLLLLLFILLLLTGIKLGQVHKDVQGVKGHFETLTSHWENYIEEEANINHVLLERITPVQGSCKKDWVSFQSSCYLINPRTSSWTLAEQQCASHGGHLVVLNTVEELDYISKVVNVHHNYWIGLVERDNDKWSWVDGTDINSTVVVWDEGQPDNWGYINDREDCGQIHYSEVRIRKMMNDANCKRNFHYICETRA